MDFLAGLGFPVETERSFERRPLPEAIRKMLYDLAVVRAGKLGGTVEDHMREMAARLELVPEEMRQAAYADPEKLLAIFQPTKDLTAPPGPIAPRPLTDEQLFTQDIRRFMPGSVLETLGGGIAGGEQVPTVGMAPEGVRGAFGKEIANSPVGQLLAMAGLAKSAGMKDLLKGEVEQRRKIEAGDTSVQGILNKLKLQDLLTERTETTQTEKETGVIIDAKGNLLVKDRDKAITYYTRLVEDDVTSDPALNTNQRTRLLPAALERQKVPAAIAEAVRVAVMKKIKTTSYLRVPGDIIPSLTNLPRR